MRQEALGFTIADLEAVEAELDRRESEQARKNFLDFICYTKKDFYVNWHHRYIADRIQAFVDKKIKNLMVFLPTQTGKSEISTRRLPAYLLGKFPDRRVGICSYSSDRASVFNRDIQRIIRSPEYQLAFPDTEISGGIKNPKTKDKYTCTEKRVEIVNRRGSLLSVGIGGSLTGDPLDYLILDDTVKNWEEALSLAYQKRNAGWWDSVAKTRLDNEGQILFVNTRWVEEDLPGYVQKSREFDFEIIVFPALKVDNNNPNDPREIGEALWPQKHSRERYEASRRARPLIFEALQQQNPGVPTDILVYPQQWEMIEEMPDYSRFYGMDFGYSTAPDCLVECMRKENRAYMRELFYETGKHISESSTSRGTDALAEKIRNAGAAGGPIYCDNASPRLIADLQSRGINALACIKGQGSLNAGILFMQGLDIHLTADSINGWLEKRKYQYPVGPDNLPVKGADPVDNWNHFMDAGRYGFYSQSIMGGRTAYETQGDFY